MNSLHNSPASAAVAPFRDCRGLIIAIAIVQLLIAAFQFLICVLIWATQTHPNQGVAGEQPPPPLAVIVSIYAVIGLMFVCLAVGNLLVKNWARIATLLLSWFWLVSGILGILFTFLVLPTALSNIPKQPNSPEISIVITIAMVVIGIFFIALPGAFLLAFHNKNVKATFLHHQPKTSSSRNLPILIWILVVWSAVGALLPLFTLFSSHPELIFGFLIWGWKGKFITLLWCALEGVIAFWIYRLDIRGWYLAIGSNLSGTVSLLAILWHPEPMQIYRDMGVLKENDVFSTEISIGATLVMMAGTFAAHLVLLLFARKYFKPLPTAPVPL